MFQGWFRGYVASGSYLGWRVSVDFIPNFSSDNAADHDCHDECTLSIFILPFGSSFCL